MYKNENDLKKYYRNVVDGSKILGNTRKNGKDVDGIEQKWVNTYFQPLVNFITSKDVWNCIAKFTDVCGEDGRRSSNKHIPVSLDRCQAHFSACHWTSRKAGEKKWFDPYDEYQPRGTNQFCGIFSMMYVLDRLPPISGNRTFQRFYGYTQAALEFCKEVINTCMEKSIQEIFLKRVNIALANYAIFINSVEFPVKI